MKRIFNIMFLIAFAGLFLQGQQDKFIVPGENLVIEGVPPIPAALAEKVGAYSEFRYAFFVDWHPLRREMLIQTRFADTYQIHQVAAPGAARTQLTFFKESIRGASFDPLQGEFIVFGRDVGGNENFQRYRCDAKGGNVTLLTDGISRNTGGVWANAHDRYAYQSTRRTNKDTDIYVMDPRRPESDRLLAKVQGGGWSALDWSPDDRWLLVGEGISINESYLWLTDAASGDMRLITPKGGQVKIAYGQAAFSRDCRGIYVITDKDSEFARLAYLDLNTGRHTYLTQKINWDVEEFALTQDRQQIAFTTNENGINVLRVLDLVSGKEKPLPALPIGQIFGMQWHRNNRDLGYSFMSPLSAYDTYSIDVETGRVERWTSSELGGLDTANFTEPRLIKWPSFDQRTISGFLYMPPATFAGKRPLVIDIHGGPEGQARPDFLGRDNFLLNELGVAIIYPNVRGSSGFGKTFLTLDNGFRREDSYRDIESLLDWVESQPFLDAERIMVTGGSYGGHMTLAVATRYPDRIRCAVTVVGVSNLVTFLENTSGYRQDLRRVEYGDERDPKMRKFLLKIAPINRAHRIAKPLFIIQGANDPRVPLSEAVQMRDVLKKAGVPVWYLVAKDEGHGFARKPNQDFQFYATVMFIKEYLLK